MRSEMPAAVEARVRDQVTKWFPLVDVDWVLDQLAQAPPPTAEQCAAILPHLRAPGGP